MNIESFKVDDWAYNAYVNEHYRECRSIPCKIFGWMPWAGGLWDEWDERWLKDALNYSSESTEVIRYEKCIILENEDVINRAPFYNHSFVVDRDHQVHAAIENKIIDLYNHFKHLEGPVIVGLFKDFDRSIGPYDGTDIPKRTVSEIPVRVWMCFPSMARNGSPVPHYDALARLHRWMIMHLWSPQYGFTDKFNGPCFTYCYKEPLDEYESARRPTYSPYVRDGSLSPDKYFPCGCKWAGQCEAQFNKNAPVRRLFMSMYEVNLNHPRIAHCFREARFRVLHTHILPMQFEMFDGCRYQLVSLNGQYMFHIFPGAIGIVRQTTGNPRYFQTMCVEQDGRKQKLEDCKRSNRFCEAQSNEITENYKFELFNNDRVQFINAIPIPAYKHYKLILTADSIVVSGENDNDERVLWYRNLSLPENPVLPLALMLTDDGELVVVDSRSRTLRGGFPDFRNDGYYEHERDRQRPHPNTRYQDDLSTRLINLKYWLASRRTAPAPGAPMEDHPEVHSDTDVDSLIQSKCKVPLDIL